MIGRPSALRLYNKRAIVHALLRSAPASRADLAKAVGMSQVTAGKIVDELLQEGIVEEVEVPLPPERATRLGRPGRMLQLNASRARFLAVQLGTNHTRLARVPIGLHALDTWSEEFETPDTGAEWKTRLTKAAKDLLDDDMCAVIVSIPGVVDERSGRVLLAPNLHWLETINVLETVQNVSSKRVTLLQESRALAYGQLAVVDGNQPQPNDFLLVDFDDGLGAAAVVGGRVYVGPLALNGELGHTPVVGNPRKCGCGAVGCIETLVSRNGLLQSMAAATGRRNPRWSQLAEHVQAHGVEPWLKEPMDYVAASIAAATNFMGLQHVIFTGSVTELPPAVVEHLGTAVADACLWKRFGQMNCHGAARHLMAGLVAAGIDRILMPVESWER
jgi:predicted NBD/HSP70 family sugar kinase